MEFDPNESCKYGHLGAELHSGVNTKSFHLIPVLYLPVSDWVMDAIAWPTGSSQSLVSNEEVQIFSTPLCGKL